MFEKYKERKEEKRLTKMQQDLEKLRARLGFNPNKMVSTSSQDEEMLFTQKIQEYKVLSSGSAKAIYDFYQASSDNDNLNYFWKATNNNYLKVHAGFPKLIADKMATLIAGKDVQFTLEVFDEANKLNEELTQKATDALKALEEKINFNDTLYQMAFTDAVFGHDIVKFNYDLSISQYPIVEVRDLTNAEVIKQRGITKAIVFHEWIDYKEQHYRLDETYTTNANGVACIKYSLFKLNASGEQVQVSLRTLPNTVGLMEYRKQAIDNPLTFVQEFEGLQGMIAFEKPNKLPNTEFNVPYGRSDISQTDLSDKLDEIASEIAGEVRNNKTISYIPSTMLQRNENGEVMRWNPFITRFQQVKGQMDQNASNEIKTDVIQDKTSSHIDKARIYMDMLCASCGLSPLTLGITSFEAVGANVSGDGFRERIKTTLDTRDAKIKRFKPYLQNIIRQLLAFNYYLVSKAGARQPGIDVPYIDFANCNVVVDFGEYVGSNESEILARVLQAKTGGLMSLEQAIKEMYPDWSDEQRLEEINRIKIENNMTLDTPELLQFDFEEPQVEETNENNN